MTQFPRISSRRARASKRLRLLSAAALAWVMPAVVHAETLSGPEEDTTETLPAIAPHWVLPTTTNQAFTLYDGDKGKILGTIPANFESNLALSPDQKTIYVATTMWTRGDHGQREDFLQAYDTHTLALAKEIEIPLRALAVFKQQDLGLSPDGRWAYIFDMSPGTRVTVVDLQAGKVAKLIDIPGCALEFPWAKNGFSALCGNGTLTNVAFDGSTVGITHSKPFFDADNAPVFEQSPIDSKTGTAFFITYDGHVFETKLGPNVTPAASWSLAVAAGLPEPGHGVQEQAWRVGGTEPFALSYGEHKLYVLMHVGPYWTHKDSGHEVWVFDTQTHKLIKRIDLPEDVKGIAVSQDKAPLLYAFGDDRGASAGTMLVIDEKTGKVARTIKAGIGPYGVVPGM